MLIYTPLPLELVWENADRFYPAYQEISLGRLRLQVEPLGFGKCKVIRIFSTDPADYLQGAYQPGNILDLLQSHFF
ncbi:MAG: hypothetical protein PWP65_1298 [Clostridia bacterium]|nr:hypothetical protein [Clostridia bacterium]